MAKPKFLSLDGVRTLVTYMKEKLATKVDKEPGKSLSDNNYSDADVAKLKSIESGAQENLIESISVNGNAQAIDQKNVNIAIPLVDATLTNAGQSADAKATGDAIAEVNQSLSQTATAIRQEFDNADNQLAKEMTQALEELSSTIPTKTSELTNDSDYTTKGYVNDEIAGLESEIPTKTSQLTNDSDYTTKQYVDGELDTLEASIPTKVSQLQNDSSYVTTTQLTNGLATKENTLQYGTATAEDVGKAMMPKTVESGKVTSWEFGEAGKVDDVRINGTSILENKVANVPIAGTDKLGVVLANPIYGISVSGFNGDTYINKADLKLIKEGSNIYRPIVPYNQHESAFYGLAKAAGDTTQSSSSNAVGAYTDEAKTAIQSMLGVNEFDFSDRIAKGVDNNGDVVEGAIIEGNIQSNKASGTQSHAEGGGTTASGMYSHAEGNNTTASGGNSHAEGSSTRASSNSSHAEGYNTTASGMNSHAEGGSTKAFGNSSHAEGHTTTASGEYSHAEGNITTASGAKSHAEGYGTIANHKSQHVFGEYNIEDTSENNAVSRGNYVEIVGNGTATNARSNARTLDWSGNEILAGKLTVGANPTNTMDVSTKGYVDTAVSQCMGVADIDATLSTAGKPADAKKVGDEISDLKADFTNTLDYNGIGNAFDGELYAGYWNADGTRVSYQNLDVCNANKIVCPENANVVIEVKTNVESPTYFISYLNDSTRIQRDAGVGKKYSGTSPVGTKYVCFTFEKSGLNVSDVQYVGVYINNKINEIDASIKENAANIGEITKTGNVEITSITTKHENEFYNVNNQFYAGGNQWNYYTFPVKQGDTFAIDTVAGGTVRGWAFRDANGNQLSIASYSGDTVQKLYENIVAPANATELIVNFKHVSGYLTISRINAKLVNENDIEHDGVLLPAYLNRISALTEEKFNILHGKILCCCGDSITYGADMTGDELVTPEIESYQYSAYTKKWTQWTVDEPAAYGYQIAARNGMTFYNGGVSGACVQGSGGTSTVPGFSVEDGEYTLLPDDIDYLTLFFGWNDTATGSLGTINDTTNDSYYGGYNVVLPYLINKYPYTKIALIVPFGTDSEHRQAIRLLANKYGIACFDMMQGGAPLYWGKESDIDVDSAIITANRAKFSAQANSPHPNIHGHYQISTMLETFLRGI